MFNMRSNKSLCVCVRVQRCARIPNTLRQRSDVANVDVLCGCDMTHHSTHLYSTYCKFKVAYCVRSVHTHINTVEPPIVDTPKSGQPPYNGQTACPLPTTACMLEPPKRGQPPKTLAPNCSEVPLYTHPVSSRPLTGAEDSSILRAIAVVLAQILTLALQETGLVSFATHLVQEYEATPSPKLGPSWPIRQPCMAPP